MVQSIQLCWNRSKDVSLVGLSADCSDTEKGVSFVGLSADCCDTSEGAHQVGKGENPRGGAGRKSA